MWPQFDEQGVIEVFVLLLRGFSYVVAGDGNPPMWFHLCAIETTLVTTRVAVGKDACGSGPVGPSQ